MTSLKRATSMEYPGTSELKAIESRLDELLRTLSRLKSENSALRESVTDLRAERARLIEKNELARTRVEAMITRLKAMEHE